TSDMSNTPPSKQLALHDIDVDDSTNATQRVGKRDKEHEFLGVPKSNIKKLKSKAFNQSLKTGRTNLPTLASQAMEPPIVAPQATNQAIVISHSKDAYSDDNKSTSSNVSADKMLPILLPSTGSKRLLDVFTDNLPKPALRTDLTTLLDRIEKIEQLVYYNTLLVQTSSLMTTAGAGEGVMNTTTTIALQMKSPLTDNELKWLDEMDKNPMKKTYIRWLTTCMVVEFIQDPNKESLKIAEVVALGPVLDRESYRKLLSSIIGGFEDAQILDIDLLQGLVQLLQTASPGFLVSDDLAKIVGVLRIRLQGTQQQSPKHSFHLTLAVSRVLDVIAEHGVKDLNHIEEYEALCGVLLGLKGSSDPYLMYQTFYAFQALQYIPNDGTALQAGLRHSPEALDGLVNVTAVFKLDLDAVLEGLASLQEALGGVTETAST
ncbi:hypothetical protein BGX24_004878, partial [Mortierella sp. AD032]